MVNISDKYLLYSVKKGNPGAFEYLFKNCYPDLCRYAFNIVRNNEVSEDLVMDVFVKLWENIEKVNITTSVSGYLFQSVHNHAINYLTRKKMFLTEINQENIERITSYLKDFNNQGPVEQLAFEELSETIEKSISLLPGECRKIFIMSRLDGLSHKEISARLGVSENTVKVQIYRALKKIRSALTGLI